MPASSAAFTVNFPTAAADNGPRNGQLPTDPFLVNGPVLNRTLLNQLYPGGQLLRNTGATWDNPDRRVPVTDSDGSVVGMLGLGDLTREATMPAPKGRSRGLTTPELARTFAAVYAERRVPDGRTSVR